MNAPTKPQIINGIDGQPAFAVIPYNEYLSLINEELSIPHEVLAKVVDGASPVKAWREHRNYTQMDMASRMSISQSAYQQLESSPNLRKSSIEKIALALGITEEQLDI